MTDLAFARGEELCGTCAHIEAIHRSRPPHGPNDYVDCLALDGGCDCRGFTPAQPAPVSRDTCLPVEPCLGCGAYIGHVIRGCTGEPPVAEASEDTEPARCQTCGYTKDSAEHDGFEPPYIVRDVLLPGPRHPFVPAPASDDEMTPGPSVAQEAWEALCDAFAAPRLETDDYSFSSQFLEARLAYEAAIRAQALSEFLDDVYEPQRDLFLQTRAALEEAREQLAAVTAERDEVRGALYEIEDMAIEGVPNVWPYAVQALVYVGMCAPHDFYWPDQCRRCGVVPERSAELIALGARPPSTESQSGSEEA